MEDLSNGSYENASSSNENIMQKCEVLPSLQCLICPQILRDKHELMTHVMEHNTEQKFHCEICFTSFRALHQLEEHKRQFHGPSHPGTSFQPESESKVPCKTCGKLFVNEYYLDKHRRKLHMQDKNIFTAAQRTMSNIQHKQEQVYKRRKYGCNKCERKFYREESLAKHAAICSKDFYECNKCQKRFTFKDSLTVHRNIVHNIDDSGNLIVPEKPTFFKCSLCTMKFDSGSELGAHDRTVHTTNKPYDCVICYQSFSNQRVLAYHIEMHTGEKPCICKRCGAIFLLPSFLQKHMKEDHPK